MDGWAVPDLGSRPFSSGCPRKTRWRAAASEPRGNCNWSPKMIQALSKQQSAESYPQSCSKNTLRKLLLVPISLTNNNQNAQRFEPSLFFENDLVEKGLLTTADLSYLHGNLACHPFGQVVADELAGQLRARGRGLGGVRSPRGLAKTLLAAAMAAGVDGWAYESQEAAVRAARLLAARRDAEWHAKKMQEAQEAQESAARFAAGPSPAMLAAREYRRNLPGVVKK
jgi:hypothetical protein